MTSMLPHPHTLATAAALIAGLAVAADAAAQTSAETPAQARARTATQALNAAPTDSTLQVGRVTAGPPLTETERPRPATAIPAAQTAPVVQPTPVATPISAPVQQPAQRPAQPQTRVSAPTPVRILQTAPDDAATRLLNSSVPATVDPAADPTAPPPAPVAPGPLVRGYYVKGDMNCDQVWPGEGDLAWLSDISFVLDFGGCEPGQIVEVGPTVWHEDQRCMTETGGDGGLYSIDYQQVETNVIVRRARLSLDDSVEEDRWTLCPTEQVPEEARFWNPNANG